MNSGLICCFLQVFSYGNIKLKFTNKTFRTSIPIDSYSLCCLIHLPQPCCLFKLSNQNRDKSSQSKFSECIRSFWKTGWL